MLAERRGLSAQAVALASSAAADLVITTEEWATSQTVALYAAFDGELDPRALDFAHGSRRIVYPIVTEGVPSLAFAQAQLGDLSPGTFGILAPTEDAPRVDPDQIDLYVVPGLAFDPFGGRLGLGRGYYDSTLAQASGRRLGFAYRWQLVDEVPVGPTDRRMHLVVTDESVLRPDTDAGY